ncbi:branched-chain amino acid transport system II carrier protein [Aquibacillus halophilus]|uniref:Branched-chain amino acid transport system carrier protein n=1 Tax=Aquibacillus halophilus TaxID=930132 RepID=A0A6A8DM07_9BACI|nr:branched-chain amino acid transport system II carrier protein [Aquibacillus halophilus]MRH44037.1 branched-chain amino acid transport system II carrier protein [Aquibacillus halophilus]
MNKHTLLIGFTLFALFFGAGNLIYPPTLGIEAGTSYWIALSGFILTGVGLPIIAVAAIALVSNHTTELGTQVHPIFAIIFSSIIYLAIGPFFGIPRAANVAYEMSITPLVTGTLNHSLMLFLFTFIFFVIVYWLSLNPSKLIDRIGQWLTPALVIAIAALSIGSLIVLDSPEQAPAEKYQDSPFFTGFLEGYLTMDAIAALAFGIIVITAFKEVGITNKKDMVSFTIKAGLIAGLALALVYGSIGLIGVKMAAYGTFENGGQILSSAAELTFGYYGNILLGVIVALACLTTSIGLTVACGQFFTKTTSISYKMVVTIVTVVSLLIANLGLNQIIAISVPVLIAIYPIAIVLVVLTLMSKWIENYKRIYRFAVLFTAVISISDGLNSFGLSIPGIQQVMESLPLYSIGLAWLIPSILGGALGWVLDKD